MPNAPEVTLRPEQAADQPAIHALTQRAFADMPYADGDEQEVVDRLRRVGALTLSLVAWERSAAGEQLVGQVTLSPAVCDDGSAPWFALGPISVEPARQSLGIGGQLMRAALDDLRGRGALGCILTGNPAYYERFGFVVSPELAPTNEPGEYFMLHQLGTTKPAGRFRFHRAFYEAL
ncbi:MAG: N-acetyltransferase [Pseudomonadota bacterium]